MVKDKKRNKIYYITFSFDLFYRLTGGKAKGLKKKKDQPLVVG